jgi:hypothetical protein
MKDEGRASLSLLCCDRLCCAACIMDVTAQHVTRASLHPPPHPTTPHFVGCFCAPFRIMFKAVNNVTEFVGEAVRVSPTMFKGASKVSFLTHYLPLMHESSSLHRIASPMTSSAPTLTTARSISII